MGVFNQFLLYKQIDIPLSLEYLENNLSGEPGHGFTIVETEDHQYKCLSNFSLGTMVARGSSGGDGIKIYMTFDPYLAFRTTVTLKTKLRPELIFAAAVVVLMTTIMIFQPSPGFNNNNLFLFPLIPVWLWLAYRAQEYLLLKRIESYLNEMVNNKTS